MKKLGYFQAIALAFFCASFAATFSKAEVYLPFDVFGCPDGTRKIVNDPVVYSAGCFESDGTETDLDLQLNRWGTQVKHIIGYGYPNSGAPRRAIITVKADYDPFSKLVFTEAFSKFSDEAKALFPDVENDSFDFVYTVEETSFLSKLISPLAMRTSERYDWKNNFTEDESTTALQTETPCASDQDFVHVEYPQGLVIEKFETGDLKVKDSTCRISHLYRPFISKYSCLNQRSNTKLEFVLELPTNTEKFENNKKYKDPAYFTFRKNGTVVFRKLITKNFDPKKKTALVSKDNLYSLAYSKFRPHYLKTPLDWDLDAAFDCFDHMNWKAKGVLKENPSSADRYDIEVIMSEMQN